MRIIKFLTSNCLYILWFVIYFTLAWALLGLAIDGLIIVSVVYGVSIIIALSPIGENLLRLLENCREPLTDKERLYLLPLFEEVYESAKEISPKLNDNIKLYVMDVMFVNAFAIGRQTIAVTKGAIETFTEYELKGILAHEFGHMTYGHTKALLLSVIGNFFFSVVIFLYKLILYLFQMVATIASFFNAVGVILSFFVLIMRWVLEIGVFIFITLSQIILALNSRTNEIQADRFAYDIGYGRELIAGLYLIQKIDITTKVKLIDRAKASHPHLAYRIGELEILENEDIEE